MFRTRRRLELGTLCFRQRGVFDFHRKLSFEGTGEDEERTKASQNRPLVTFKASDAVCFI